MNKPTGNLLADIQSAPVMPAAPPSLERRRLRAYIAMLFVDLVLLHIGFGVASYFYEGPARLDRGLIAAQGLLPIFYTVALYNQSYSARALVDWQFGLRKMAIALFISVALVNFLAFYLKANDDFSRVAVTLGLVLSFVMLAIFRRGLVMVVHRRWKGRIRNRLVIDDGGPAFELDQALAICAHELDLNPCNQDPYMRDRLGKLMRNQDRVVVSCPEERRESWSLLLKAYGVFGEIVSEATHDIGAVGVHRYDDQDISTLIVSSGPLGMRARVTKRLFDIAASLAGIVILSPLLIGIAIAIRLEDGGKALFVQRRLGKGNRFFDMLKFRSMREDKLDGNGDKGTARDDDRVTRIGALIRSTSIDELPQLWNVLRGDMSIVGPRPHAIGSRANSKLFWEVDARYWKRHSLKPGLTGLAQVRGHRGTTEHEKDLTDRLQSDLEYIQNWSLRHDVEIIIKTLLVLRHDNAY